MNQAKNRATYVKAWEFHVDQLVDLMTSTTSIEWEDWEADRKRLHALIQEAADNEFPKPIASIPEARPEVIYRLHEVPTAGSGLDRLTWPWCVHVNGEPKHYFYTAKQAYEWAWEQGVELLSEEPLQLVRETTYEARDGSLWEVVTRDHDNSKWPWYALEVGGTTAQWYTDDGSYIGTDAEHELDLIRVHTGGES